MHKPQQFPVARQSAGPSPLRRPGSIRRTTSIDSDWPDGHGMPWILTGLARDLWTPFDGSPMELAFGSFRIRTSTRREIMEIETSPQHPRSAELIGVRAGGASRTKLSELLGDTAGTPLFQILDDFAGASLVANWVWSRWPEFGAQKMALSELQSTAGRQGAMVDICVGFERGSSSLGEDGAMNPLAQTIAPVGPLENPDDPMGWHAMPSHTGPFARRARRMDIWCADGLIHVDAGFQDSGSVPDGTLAAVHEYRLYAEIDQASGTLVTIQALPLILPFKECPGAAVKIGRLVGKNVAEFRTIVPTELASTLGCTHLNDVARALADAPAIAAQLPLE